jgi:uncharacterized protein (UPF0216 family)|tara:strand:+ start:271 stop:705 length:435 start_codon:yes stop_codon:yes gene_type:complete
MAEESSDRVLEEYFSAEFRVLNAHLPRSRKSLAELIAEAYPSVPLSDGSAHFFKSKELAYLAGMLNDNEQRALLLPILIQIMPGQSDIGILCGTQNVEAKALSCVLGMPVTDDGGKITMYKSQLSEIRAKLKTTTQYMFSIRGL